MPSTIDYTRILRCEFENPNPLDYNLLIFGKNGTEAKVYLDGVVQYVKACRIVYKDNTFYQFDGCIYNIVSEDDLMAVMDNAVDICTRIAKIPGIVITKTQKANAIAKLKSICTMDLIDWNDCDLSAYESMDDQEDMFEEDVNRGEFDHIIPFNNGLYNIQTDTLLPFTPGIFITRKCRSNYDPTINSCPEAERIFELMIPDKATRSCFYQMVGYTLFANRITGKDASIFIMYGQGANGKGTVQDIITRILGDNHVSALDLAQVTAKFTSNLLDGSLVNFCSDASDRSSSETKIDRGVLKTLATGEPVIVQRKNEKPYKMWNCAKLWFMANTQPDLGGVDGGIIRRLHVIHLTHVFTVDDDIQKVLMTRKAIQWFTYTCLTAYIEFLALNSRFSDSDAMINERNYYTLVDNIYDFLYNRYSTDIAELIDMVSGVSTTALYQEYKAYCIDGGSRPVPNRTFYLKLRTDFNLGIRKENTTNSLGNRSSVNVLDEIGVKGAK